MSVEITPELEALASIVYDVLTSGRAPNTKIPVADALHRTRETIRDLESGIAPCAVLSYLENTDRITRDRQEYRVA
jgi:hypothetical protein